MTEYILESINISPLIKAFSVFQKFLPNSNTEQEKAGTIQAFEFCYELSWKMIKRILTKKGLTATSPRDTFRLAAQSGLIKDPEIWFQFIEKRNLTVHTYEETYIDEVMLLLPTFNNEMEKLIKNIRSLI